MNRKKKFLCLVLGVIFYNALLGYAKEPFAIKDNNFLADHKKPCKTDVQIKSVKGTSFGVSGKLSVINGQTTFWCYGARHTWIGKLTYADFTFDSDKDNPLQFVIDKDKGYLYVKGQGTITFPNGKIRKLP